MKYTGTTLIILLMLNSFTLLAQWTPDEVNEIHVATRAGLLTGTAYAGSASGWYIVTFPSPNECVVFAPVRAASRMDALYRTFTKGGFTLKPSDASLTVWTIEEWNDFKKKSPEFFKQFEEHCKGAH
jgi:hypothetical protein